MKILIEQLQEHPENKLFHDLPDDELQVLADDLRENGLIHAVVVRNTEAGYQIVSGHQRVRAARWLGWTEIDAQVVTVNDNQAARMLIAANIKTRALSPMELARAIRREKELIEETHGPRQGERTDLTSATGEPKLQGRWSEAVSQEMGKSEQNVRRLDKLNELIPSFQSMVDQGKISIKAGEQLAHLSPDIQQAVWETIGQEVGDRTVEEIKNLRGRMRQQEQDHLENDRRFKKLVAERDRLKAEGRPEDRQRIAQLEDELASEAPAKVPESIQQELRVWKNRISEMEAEKRQREEDVARLKASLDLEEKSRSFAEGEVRRLEKENAKLEKGLIPLLPPEEQERIQAQEELERDLRANERAGKRASAVIKLTGELVQVQNEADIEALTAILMESNPGRELGEVAIKEWEHASGLLQRMADAVRKNIYRLEVVK